MKSSKLGGIEWAAEFFPVWWWPPTLPPSLGGVRVSNFRVSDAHIFCFSSIESSRVSINFVFRASSNWLRVSSINSSDQKLRINWEAWKIKSIFIFNDAENVSNRVETWSECENVAFLFNFRFIFADFVSRFQYFGGNFHGFFVYFMFRVLVSF